MQFDLEPYRKQIKAAISKGVTSYKQSLPITRLDVVFDLTSMDVPMVQSWLDTEPTGEPGSDSSQKFDVCELVMSDWAEPCGAAFDGEDVLIRFGGKILTANDEESLNDAIGQFLQGIIQAIRDDGGFAGLKKAKRCYLGVSTFDGSWAWPEYENRGTDDLA